MPISTLVIATGLFFALRDPQIPYTAGSLTVLGFAALALGASSCALGSWARQVIKDRRGGHS